MTSDKRERPLDKPKVDNRFFSPATPKFFQTLLIRVQSVPNDAGQGWKVIERSGGQLALAGF